MNIPDALPNERDTLVFWVLPGLRYRWRMAVAPLILLAGLLVQWRYGEPGWAAGALLLVLGNLLLLVKGYDNRLDRDGWSPELQWQPVEREKLGELLDLDRRMRRWDRSFMDITNAWGLVAFFLLLVLLFGAWVALADSPMRILPVDAAILLLPHWFTGTRRILRLPGLLVKAETLERVLREVHPESDGDRVEVFMLLKGKEHPLPEDVKIRLMPGDAPEEFLGLQGQVVINEVQGKSHPYFYVVLVARPGLGLKELAGEFNPPEGLVKEFSSQEDAEVLVLRQRTTRTSGYHTGPERVRELLETGRSLARRLVASD